MSMSRRRVTASRLCPLPLTISPWCWSMSVTKPCRMTSRSNRRVRIEITFMRCRCRSVMRREKSSAKITCWS
tara:strand:- start:38453 stop:38668 length:216 start_codon:yes stop_codon:yes gene_type:complete